MPSRLADRLSAARRHRFVGRSGELALFESAIKSAEPPFQVLYLFGPGGVGKSSLLREYAALAAASGIQSVYLDARSIEPAPFSLLAALAAALGLESGQSPTDALAARTGRTVLLLDTFEILAPLESWLRDRFLPELPENTLVVLAGREPPSPEWHADPGWQTLLRVISLRNLSPDEGREYLTRRRVPAAEHSAVLDFTHSHPLALSLLADVYDQRSDFQFKPEAAPDVVQALLEQFVQQVPGPAHRAALEACALVRVTTESVLAAMLALPDPAAPDAGALSGGVYDLFEWLRSLSFIEARPEGLFPHDLAREALSADVRWRNPDWYAELHRRARQYYRTRLQQSTAQAQPGILFDYIFLHRDNPVVRPFFEWQGGGVFVADILREPDILQLTATVARHEGQESAKLAAHWLQVQPSSVVVVRDAESTPNGFVMMLRLDQATPADLRADPAAQSAWRYLETHAPLRPGEVATYFRFWMAHDTYQSVSAVQSVIFVNIVRHYLATPGLAFTFFPTAAPDFWLAVLTYADLQRLPDLDFEMDGHRYGVYGHDWRVVPPIQWLTLLAERETAQTPIAVPPPPSTTSLIVLSQDEFTGAVHAALRDLTRPHRLHENPLLRSRIVVERAGASAGPDARMAALQAIIREVVEQPQVSPREARLYRAVQYTYLKPAVTQEQAAEMLDVPFSTYRRHLKAGLVRVVELLWQREIGAARL